MNTINERIQMIIDNKFDSVRSFAIHIKQNYQTIRNIVGERKSKPSSDILTDIINSIDHINADWLLTGKGQMFHSSGDDVEYDIEEKPKRMVSSPSAEYNSEYTIHLEKELANAEKQMANMNIDLTNYRRLVNSQQKELDEKDKLIAELRAQLGETEKGATG